MAGDPVTVAASNNPLPTTVTAAVSGRLNPNVNLVDAILNGGEFTVFAPTDDAFAKIPPAIIDSLKADSATRTKILTCHVAPGRVAPQNINGPRKTAEGGTVTVTGGPDALKVNDASVICGGVNVGVVEDDDGALQQPGEPAVGQPIHRLAGRGRTVDPG